MLSQLLQKWKGNKLPDAVHKLNKDYQHTTAPTEQTLSAIRSLVIDSSHIFVICDALDECPNVEDESQRLCNEREEVCNALKVLSDWGLPNLHILVSLVWIFQVFHTLLLFVASLGRFTYDSTALLVILRD